LIIQEKYKKKAQTKLLFKKSLNFPNFLKKN